MFKLAKPEEIKEQINKYFSIIYNIPSTYHVFLVGGSIRSISLNEQIKDLDFVFLDSYNTVNNYILEFINNYSLNYTFNEYGGYKINYNGFMVDLWKTKDLLYAIQFNADGLFYDIHNNYLITFGIYDALENGLRELNEVGGNLHKPHKEGRKAKILKQLDIKYNE